MDERNELHCHRIASVQWEDDPDDNILVAIPFSMRGYDEVKLISMLDAAVRLSNHSQNASFEDFDYCLRVIGCWRVEPVKTTEKLL